MSRITRSTTALTRSGALMCQNFQRTFMTDNHETGKALADASPDGRKVQPVHDDPMLSQQFADLLSYHATCLQDSLKGQLTPHHAQLLSDMKRSDRRYGFVALTELMELTRKSKNPTHQRQLSDIVRMLTVSESAPSDLYAADVAESDAEYECNSAVKKFRQFCTRLLKHEALTKIRSHIAKLEALESSVKATPVR